MARAAPACVVLCALGLVAAVQPALVRRQEGQPPGLAYAYEIALALAKAEHDKCVAKTGEYKNAAAQHCVSLNKTVADAADAIELFKTGPGGGQGTGLTTPAVSPGGAPANPCGQHERQCCNRQCVRASYRSDGKDDCGDNSDEDGKSCRQGRVDARAPPTGGAASLVGPRSCVSALAGGARRCGRSFALPPAMRGDRWRWWWRARV